MATVNPSKLYGVDGNGEPSHALELWWAKKKTGLTAAEVRDTADQALAAASAAETSAKQAASSSTQAQQLMAQWTAQAPLGGPAAQLLTAYRSYGSSNLVVALAGDTAWARKWSQDYGQQLPSGLSRVFGTWSGSAWQWAQDAAGAGGTPATGGTLVQDGLGRTGDVVASAPDAGPKWAGTAGVWSMSNGLAAPSAAGTMAQQIATGDQDQSWTLSVVTTKPSASQSMRLYAGAGAAGLGSGAWVSVSLSTSGALSVGLYKTVGSTTTTLAGSTGVAGCTLNSTSAQQVSIALSVRGTSVTATATCAGQTTSVTGTLATGDLPGAWAGAYCPAYASPYPFSIDAVTMGTPYIAGAPGPGITWLAHSGLATSDLAQAFPSTPRVDVLIVAADQTAATTFVSEWRKLPGQGAPAVLVAGGADVPALTMPVAPTTVTANTTAIAQNTSAIAALQAKPAPTGMQKAALERFRALKAFTSGQCVIGVVSDSTGNDGVDWLRVWHQVWGATLPASVRRTYNAWDATTLAWKAEVVDAAGAAPDTGVVLDDAFTTAGDVVGSTPQSGVKWAGTSGAWSSDGQVAKSSAAGSISTDMSSRDGTFSVTLKVVTTKPSGSRSLRIYWGNAWANLTLSTSGALTIQPWISSTSLTPAQTVAGLTADSATAQTVTVTVKVAIQQVTVTATVGSTTTTVAGTMSESDYASQGTKAALTSIAPDASYPYTVDTVHAQTPAKDNPVPPPTLTMWNASTAGQSFAYFDSSRRATMFGGKAVDVLIVSMGHNNGAQSGSDFVAQVSAWVDAYKTEHPETALLVSSQNPEFAPSSTRAAHAARQAALRTWARDKGYDYIAAFEAFAAKGDGGQSLVLSDGIHPTTPSSGTTGDYGSVLWASTLTQTIGA